LRGPRAGGCKKKQKMAPRANQHPSPRRSAAEPEARTRTAFAHPRCFAPPPSQPPAWRGGRWAVGGGRGGSAAPLSLPGASALPSAASRPGPPPPPRPGAPPAAPSGPAARSHSQKATILARFKGNNTRRPLFFFCVCWHGTSKQHFRSKNSRREGGGPAQRLRAAAEQLTGEHSTPTFDFFSAGVCLVVIVSNVALCGAKPNSLTPLGLVGLPLLTITM
jgi:hypothetical protein